MLHVRTVLIHTHWQHIKLNKHNVSGMTSTLLCAVLQSDYWVNFTVPAESETGGQLASTQKQHKYDEKQNSSHTKRGQQTTSVPLSKSQTLHLNKRNKNRLGIRSWHVDNGCFEYWWQKRDLFNDISHNYIQPWDSFVLALYKYGKMWYEFI